MDKNSRVAVLVVEVDFEEMPDHGELEEIVESLKGYGHVRVAKLSILKETEIDMR